MSWFATKNKSARAARHPARATGSTRCQRASGRSHASARVYRRSARLCRQLESARLNFCAGCTALHAVLDFAGCGTASVSRWAPTPRAGRTRRRKRRGSVSSRAGVTRFVSVPLWLRRAAHAARNPTPRTSQHPVRVHTAIMPRVTQRRPTLGCTSRPNK